MYFLNLGVKGLRPAELLQTFAARLTKNLMFSQFFISFCPGKQRIGSFLFEFSFLGHMGWNRPGQYWIVVKKILGLPSKLANSKMHWSSRRRNEYSYASRGLWATPYMTDQVSCLPHQFAFFTFKARVRTSSRRAFYIQLASPCINSAHFSFKLSYLAFKSCKFDVKCNLAIWL